MGARAFPPLCILCLSLLACDSKRDQEYAAAEKAALEEIETRLRPQAEKRLTILKTIAERWAEASRSEPAPIRLGDRPAVRILIHDEKSGYPAPSERGFNGRALPAHDLANLSKPILEKPLSLFGDRQWIDEGLPALRNPHSVGSRSSRDRIREFLSVRYLAVVREDSYLEPKVELGSIGTAFKEGRLSATFFLFDLEDGACLGGAKAEAASSEKVRYQFRDARNAGESLASTIRTDLLKNLESAILKALVPE